MRKHILICFLNLISICVIAQVDNEIKREVILLYVPVKETYLITSVHLNQFAQLLFNSKDSFLLDDGTIVSKLFI